MRVLTKSTASITYKINLSKNGSLPILFNNTQISTSNTPIYKIKSQQSVVGVGVSVSMKSRVFVSSFNF